MSNVCKHGEKLYLKFALREMFNLQYFVNPVTVVISNLISNICLSVKVPAESTEPSISL